MLRLFSGLRIRFSPLADESVDGSGGRHFELWRSGFDSELAALE